MITAVPGDHIVPVVPFPPCCPCCPVVPVVPFIPVIPVWSPCCPNCHCCPLRPHCPCRLCCHCCPHGLCCAGDPIIHIVPVVLVACVWSLLSLCCLCRPCVFLVVPIVPIVPSVSVAPDVAAEAKDGAMCVQKHADTLLGSKCEHTCETTRNMPASFAMIPLLQRTYLFRVFLLICLAAGGNALDAQPTAWV